jgi:hypothetical protein
MLLLPMLLLLQTIPLDGAAHSRRRLGLDSIGLVHGERTTRHELLRSNAALPRIIIIIIIPRACPCSGRHPSTRQAIGRSFLLVDSWSTFRRLHVILVHSTPTPCLNDE